ncbi:MAG: B12-binding domain-containing radical SAM protein [Defluviitaleaceae bacterium]|nr:B12-binding domain-containing radical SAM protein [Defluviitaleaceae bacterium]
MKTTKPLFVGMYETKRLGIRYLSSALKKHGYDTNLIFLKDFNSYAVDEPTDAEYHLFCQLIEELNPGYIGFSIMSSFYLEVVKKLATLLRQHTNVPIIVGGAYVSLFPEKCLEFSDVAFRGECEEAIVEFTDALENGQPFEHLDNLCTNGPDGPRINEVRLLKHNLDSIPHPDFGGDHMYYINNDKIMQGDPAVKTHSYELTTSRGCPNRCSYCSTGSIRDLYKGKGPFIRQRSIQDVMQELEDVKQKNPGLQVLRFWDEIFPWNKEWVAEFARQYKAKINLPFEVWGHPKLSANKECLEHMVAAGLSKIVIGVQSGCPKTRKDIYTRNETQGDILNCSNSLAAAKVPLVIYDFILGHPFETPEDLRETLELCRKLAKPFLLQLHGLSFLPGTPIEEIAVRHGVKTWDEIRAEQARPLREQYHSMAWWRQGHGAGGNKEKVYWYTLIYLTQFPSGERIIRWALKNEALKKNPSKLLLLHKIYNLRVKFQMGSRKLRFMLRNKLR